MHRLGSVHAGGLNHFKLRPKPADSHTVYSVQDAANVALFAPVAMKSALAARIASEIISPVVAKTIIAPILGTIIGIGASPTPSSADSNDCHDVCTEEIRVVRLHTHFGTKILAWCMILADFSLPVAEMVLRSLEYSYVVLT